MSTYRVIYCHDNPKQPWYTFYAHDVRRAFMAGTALADTGHYDVMIETGDGWLFLHVDPADNSINMELMGEDGVQMIEEMSLAAFIVDHPLSDPVAALAYLAMNGSLQPVKLTT